MISITRSPAAADAEASTNNLVAPTSIPSAESTIDTIEVGRPHELLEIQDSAAGQEEEEEMVYPTGPKLWMTLISLCIALFLHGLDLTIVAVTVPSLTDQFKTVNDIGWYSAAYMMVASGFIFLFGRAYTLFSTKAVFMSGVVVFELGSLLCTFARTSKMFIVGRSIAGFGASAFQAGMLMVLRHSLPIHKQPVAISIAMTCSSAGLVSAPMIGGALTDALSWRACFGINIPLGLVCVVFTWFGFSDPVTLPELALPLKTKLRRLDPLSTLLVVPSITCFLMALQWGGIRYGWSDWRIILLFVLFAILFLGFAYSQYRLGDNATLPPRVIKRRSIIAALWFSGCCNGVLAVTEYYISIYFQGVRGLSASTAGLLGLPMIAGMGIATVSAGLGTKAIGYYFPFMFATSILAPVASGLLTTLDLDESNVKVAALLGFLGVAIGLGMHSPMLVVQTTLPAKDVSLGSAIVGFGGGMGSALWTCASATLFQTRLVDEIQSHAQGVNGTALEDVGLSDLRTAIGSEHLRDVLSGYNEAVSQTLYIPLALGCLTILGSIATERNSVKKKTK